MVSSITIIEYCRWGMVVIIPAPKKTKRRDIYNRNQEKHLRRMESLRATRQFFDTLVLRGQPDPHRELFASRKPLIVGPAGSLLLAMVRIPVSGGRSLYRRIANRALFEDREAQELIQSRFLSPGTRLASTLGRNPAIVADTSGEVLEKLEWHHSPNHILTVCLIPRQLHHRRGLHAAGRGGHDMFWIGNPKR
jgi:hypothetical protein